MPCTSTFYSITHTFHVNFLTTGILHAFTDLQSGEASTIPVQATRIIMNMTLQKIALQYHKR
jgi:hypothetical protein